MKTGLPTAVRRAEPFLPCAIALTGCASAAPAAESLPARPNIVFIVADDLGAEASDVA